MADRLLCENVTTPLDTKPLLSLAPAHAALLETLDYIGNKVSAFTWDHYYMSVHQWSEEDRPKSRCLSARAPRTPRAVSPRRQYHAVEEEEDELVSRNNARNRRKSMARPASARDPSNSTFSRRASLTQRPAFSVY